VSAGHGKEQVVHARRAIAPPVTQLVRRAVAAGVVRADMSTSDVPLINFMLNAIADFSRDDRPELYKRYLAIVLDGLKPRDGVEPLPVDALSVREFQDIVAKT
jgi:transcriptional regulator SbtR-like protein